MKKILISVRPKWCEKICHVIGKEEAGKPIYEKRIEVRKSAPKEVPFKAYIYCTKDKPYLYRIDDDNNFELTNTLRPKTYEYVKDYNEQNGKVIGEFICDKTERFSVGSLRSDDIEKLACLSYNEMINYFYKPEELDGKTVKQGFAWHISDLKIYDKPKELSEFYTIAESGSDCCCGCVWHETPLFEMPCRTCTGERKYLYRPPQSWCYVEER
jgi:predicted transcriptional regulator